ncbi:MAG: MATE family efflux transporter [Clostridiales bacterium]|nr:MATE family efflux transporter [Clostridiales bacterium]
MKSHEIDMSTGSLLPKLFMFSIPVMLSGLLQLLFNAADLVVVGKFAGSIALAQVGATTAIINLIINLLVGLAIGTNVTLARYFGAKDERGISETVHTTMVLAVVGGTLIGVIGVAFARPLLTMMGTPEDILDGAVLYMRIVFVGAPVSAVYNYGAAILRAVGDTRRPMYFLMAAGILNVLLNLFFVIVCKLAVAGVAIATTLSQALSMVLVVRCLMKSEGFYRLEVKKLRIYKDKLFQLLRLGIPAGLQGCVFSFSNVIIQSSINTFGSAVISGNTAAASIDGFMFCTVDSFNQTATSAISQNMGARDYKRAEKVVLYCTIITTLMGAAVGLIATIFRQPLISIYSGEAEVIEHGVYRLLVLCPIYFTAGLMNMMGGVNRGLGYSMLPTIVSLIGACAFRIIWIYTVFAAVPTLFMLYISYPITWTITAAAHYVCYFAIRKKAYARNEAIYAQ